MYWSVHQYHSPMMGEASITPSHGVSLGSNRKPGKPCVCRRRRQRAPEMDRLGIGGPQAFEAADFGEAPDQDDERADQHQRRLHALGPQHRLHAAGHGVGPGDDDQREGREPEVVGGPQQRQIDRLPGLVAEDGRDRDRAGVDGHRGLGQDVGDHEDEREHGARGRRVALLEELGRREDARAQVEGREHPAQHDAEVRVQLPVRERHARAGAGAGQADQVLGADVGREDRGADEEPAGVPAGQEVVLGVLLLLQRHPDGDAGDHREIDRDDGPVEPREGDRCARPHGRGGLWHKGDATPATSRQPSVP